MHRVYEKEERGGLSGLGLAPQEGSVYFLEGGPLLAVSPPAAQHGLVEWVWTQHWLGKVDLHRTQEGTDT